MGHKTKAKSKSSASQMEALTLSGLRARLISPLHGDSKVVVRLTDPFGFPIQFAVKGVRATMGDSGKPDFVEILV